MTNTATAAIPTTDPVYTGVPAIAGRLGCSHQTVRNLIHRGEIPAVRIGRQLLIRRADFENFMAASAV